METTAAVADEQWATIERRLDGSPADIAVVRRHLRKRIWVVLVPLVLVAGVAGAVVGLGAGGESLQHLIAPTSGGTADTVRLVVAVALMIAALVVWVTGAVRTHRRRGFPWSWKEPTVGLGRVQRRALERTLSGRVAPAAERIPVLRRLAVLRMHQSVWVRWLFAGWIPLSIGQAANAGVSWLGLLHLVLAVFWAVMLAVTAAQRRRWRTFIEQHADDVGDPTP